MLEVADVFRRYGDNYLRQFGRQMLPSHRRAFTDICSVARQPWGHMSIGATAVDTSMLSITPAKIGIVPSAKGN